MLLFHLVCLCDDVSYFKHDEVSVVAEYQALVLIILPHSDTLLLLFEARLLINAFISLFPFCTMFPVTRLKHGDMPVGAEYPELPAFAAESIRAFRKAPRAVSSHYLI